MCKDYSLMRYSLGDYNFIDSFHLYFLSYALSFKASLACHYNSQIMSLFICLKENSRASIEDTAPTAKPILYSRI